MEKTTKKRKNNKESNNLAVKNYRERNPDATRKLTVNGISENVLIEFNTLKGDLSNKDFLAILLENYKANKNV